LGTERLGNAETALLRLVKEYGGFVGGEEGGGKPGGPRRGGREGVIPRGGLVALFAAGVPTRGGRPAHDHSADEGGEGNEPEARLASKRVEEARLLKHLTSSTGKLSEILEVERELSRVRGEIEQLEGRRRFLANQTELTTVTISIQEVKAYAAPGPPTFAT